MDKTIEVVWLVKEIDSARFEFTYIIWCDWKHFYGAIFRNSSDTNLLIVLDYTSFCLMCPGFSLGI